MTGTIGPVTWGSYGIGELGSFNLCWEVLFFFSFRGSDGEKEAKRQTFSLGTSSYQESMVRWGNKKQLKKIACWEVVHRRS